MALKNGVIFNNNPQKMRPNATKSGECDQKLEQTIISVFSNIISIFIQR